MKARQFNDDPETLIGQIGHENKQKNPNDDPRLTHGVGNADNAGTDDRIDQVGTRTDEARLCLGHADIGDSRGLWSTT